MMNDPDSTGPNRDEGNPTAQQAAYEPACDECRVRKVKCNKEYPKCSSCRKSNLPCGFSNKGKRVNHTKRLINDVELLGSRLGKIEDALTRCLSAVEASSSIHGHSTPTASPKYLSTYGQMDLSEDFVMSPEHFDGSSDDSQSNRYYLFVGEHGYERFYGPSSMFSLYAEAQTACSRLMSSLSGYDGDKSLQPPVSVVTGRLQDATNLFQTMSKESPSVVEPDLADFVPSIPPRVLMEVFLETYLTDLSPLLPIFDHRSILAAMQEQYASDTESPDLAWITSFNHILLQTLAAKLNASRKSGLLGCGTLENGLISNLLQNAKRCCNIFEKLLKPRVANVQALLSLALIALKYFPFTTFEALFSQACQLSKSIGLHHNISRAGPTNEYLETERQNLFWSLFIVDKHASLIAGKPCLLPSYDCSAPLPTVDNHFTARVHLAHIQEDLYRNLYSAEVRHIGRDSINRRANNIGRRLQSWAAQHEPVLSPTGSGPVPSPNKYCAMELRYALSTCWVLIQRRMVATQSKNTSIEHARASLTLFKEFCLSYQPGDGFSGFGVFDNICLNYSMISFLEVFIHLLDNYESEDQPDYDSLSFFASKAECLAAMTASGSYSSKIRHVTDLCNQVAESLRSLKEGGRAQSLSAAVSSRGTTLSNGHSTGQGSFEPDALRTPSGISGARDQFWDVFSYPLEGSLGFDKMTAGNREQTDHGSLMECNSLFLMPDGIGSNIMPPDPVDFHSILDAFSGDNHGFGGVV